MPCNAVPNDIGADGRGSRCCTALGSTPPRRRVAVERVSIMTTDPTSDDEISTPKEFEAALGRVILAALESDVDPRGAWEFRNGEAGSDVEVMMVELAD